jgi:hypothetical protein
LYSAPSIIKIVNEEEMDRVYVITRMVREGGRRGGGEKRGRGQYT